MSKLSSLVKLCEGAVKQETEKLNEDFSRRYDKEEIDLELPESEELIEKTAREADNLVYQLRKDKSLETTIQRCEELQEKFELLIKTIDSIRRRVTRSSLDDDKKRMYKNRYYEKALKLRQACKELAKIVLDCKDSISSGSNERSEYLNSWLLKTLEQSKVLGITSIVMRI